jgi:hypothetical protein
MLRMADLLPQEWEIDYEDLGNVYGRARIQSCNACVSTSMALCVWPCNCYEKGHKKEPDLMWDLDMYARLDLADAWAIIGPINWYGPTSNLKLMFDRLVCMNGGNPREDLIEHKDAELAMALEHTPEWEGMSLNHLEGRTAGFFCYGDAGGDELDPEGRPKLLKHAQALLQSRRRTVWKRTRHLRTSRLAVSLRRSRGPRSALALRRIRKGREIQRQSGGRSAAAPAGARRVGDLDRALHRFRSPERKGRTGKASRVWLQGARPLPARRKTRLARRANAGGPSAGGLVAWKATRTRS